VFEIHDGDVQVIDLGSQNGTYVNKSRINKCLLAPGDEISIGSTIITYFTQYNGEDNVSTDSKSDANDFNISALRSVISHAMLYSWLSQFPSEKQYIKQPYVTTIWQLPGNFSIEYSDKDNGWYVIGSYQPTTSHVTAVMSIATHMLSLAKDPTDPITHINVSPPQSRLQRLTAIYNEA
jgi:pSer/pThr/pTyr-binding forkhead associated (FHA) protein